MPVGSESLAAGAYTATWNSVALGIFEGDEGLPALEGPDAKSEPVNNTSLYGKMTIDEIYQGVDYFMSFTCLEWRAGVTAAFHPYSATMGVVGVIARLLYDLSSPLVLTVVAGTPAAVTGPTTLTANKAFPVPGFTPRVRFGPTLRRTPLRFRFFPYSSGGNIIHYVMA